MMATCKPLRQRLAEGLAMPMFGVSLLYLALLAAVVVLWVDVPMMFERGPDESAAAAAAATPVLVPAEAYADGEQALRAGYHCVKCLEALWLVVVLEFVVRVLVRDRGRPCWHTHRAGLVPCLCPPLRLCARIPDMDGKIWLPWLRWRKPNMSLRNRLERLFSVPMIFIALAILPVLLIEFGMRQQVMTHRWLRVVLHASLGVIWFAFATEFIVMFSVSDKKLKYCRKHWLDIAIILLPFISFLRSLRIVRATRVARLARVEQLARMGRLYRLRGLAMRALRATLLLNLLNRLFRVPPDKQLRRLREELREREADIRLIRHQIAELERTIAAQQAAEQGNGPAAPWPG